MIIVGIQRRTTACWTCQIEEWNRVPYHNIWCFSGCTKCTDVVFLLQGCVTFICIFITGFWSLFLLSLNCSTIKHHDNETDKRKTKRIDEQIKTLSVSVCRCVISFLFQLKVFYIFTWLYMGMQLTWDLSTAALLRSMNRNIDLYLDFINCMIMGFR